MSVDLQQIEELLGLAYVPSERHDQARRYLIALLTPGPTGKSPARSVYDAGLRRGTATPHNDKLRAVEAAVVKLEDTLRNLRNKPYAHTDFWYSEAFGPVHSDNIERPEVVAALEMIRKASVDARMHTTRRKQSENYNLARLAVRFFKKFTNETSNRELHRFVEAFFEAVTGKAGAYENEELTRAIQAGLKAETNLGK